MIISDVAITIPFRVKDLTTGNYIFSIMDRSAPGDMPPDIAVLPVVGVSVDRSGYMEIETEVAW